MENFDLRKYLAENKLLKEDNYDTSYDLENIKNTDILKIGGHLANHLGFPLRNVKISDDIIMLGRNRYQVVPKPNNDFDIINIKTKEIIDKDVLVANLLDENKLLKEEKTYDIYGDGDVVIDISRATPEQERLIRWESDPENGLSEFENSEDAQKFANEIMNLNSTKEVKNYYDNVRGWATVDYLSTSNALNAFVGNKQIPEGKLLKENQLFSKYIQLLK